MDRLDRLPDDARELAELAAVLGSRIPFNRLRAVSAHSESRLLEILDLLTDRRSRILTESLTRNRVVYDFTQPLLREALLSELGLARTRILHGTVARTLRDHLADRDPDKAGILAYHFLRSGPEEAGPELEKTREMFREIGSRPPRKAAEGEGELSPRELQVARLVQERKSNKAVARELGISPRTVSTHLSNIYGKLAIGSRGELADFMRNLDATGG
jgi:DNA-binding CsgD family transcriptional regulator